MKKILFAIISLSVATLGFAQNEVDGLRYSQVYSGTTARSLAMGGAFSSLGGDFSCLSTNPAGLGIYRKSEMMISPSLNFNSTIGDYLGGSYPDSKTSLNIGNFGFIGSYTSDNDAGWVSVNFGIGLNRLNNFNNSSTVAGVNNESSLLDYFMSRAQNKNYESFSYFYEGLAWETYLIDYQNYGDGPYQSVLSNWSDTIANTYGLEQRKSVISSGSLSEVPISLAANYMNKVYVGITCGLQTAKYFEDYEITETDTTNVNQYLNHYTFGHGSTTRGTGINLKVGMIYRPIDWMRFGIALHTPTLYDFKYKYYSSMDAVYDTIIADGKSEFNSRSDGEYDYQVTTPFRAIGSLGFVIQKTALVSLEYEFVDYSLIKMSSQDAGEFSDVNNSIRTNYTAASNVKVGLEYAYGPFRLRAGGGYYGSPYASSSANKDAYKVGYSGGFGIVDKKVYFDLAYSHISGKENHYLYSPDVAAVQPASITTNNNQIVATFGVRF